MIDKKELFKLRTGYHLYLVNKWSNKILNNFPLELENDRKLFEKERDEHDKLKWVEPEYTPYVELTWDYKCKELGFKNEISAEIKDKIHEATLHHIKRHKHHPEYWSDDVYLNKEDRDKPPGSIVDASKMPLVYIASMVADWFAMSEEKGGHPKDWADKNVNIRWKFNDEQVTLIYNLIEKIWDKT